MVQHSMKKYFDLWFDLMNIENRYDAVEECVSQYPTHHIVSGHPFIRVFSGYQALIQQKITEEEFLQIGDILEQKNDIFIKNNNKVDNFELFNDILFRVKNALVDENIRKKIFIFPCLGISKNDMKVIKKFLLAYESFIFFV